MAGGQALFRRHREAKGHSPRCISGRLTTRQRAGVIAHFILGTRDGPTEASHLQTPLPGPAQGPAGARSPDARGAKKAQGSVLLGPRAHLGSSGWRDRVWPGHSLAGRRLGRGRRPGRGGRTCCHLDDAASRKLERTFQVGKNSWQTCGFRKGAGPLIVTPVRPASLPGTRPPGLAGPGSSRAASGGRGRQGLGGLETREEFTEQTCVSN